MSFPILTALVLVPAAGSLPDDATFSERRAEWIKLVAVLVSVFTGAMSWCGCCRRSRLRRCRPAPSKHD
ncbi:MAG: hypothetical protein R2713_20955 [Ilumatobacteraceae bacterium]